MAEANADDRALLLAAAGEAGAVALSYFGGNQRTWLKEGGSIVGEADIAVDRRLSEILRTARPDYGWLSEESVDEPERLTRSRTFVVDPIDGTRAYVAGRKEWTISLAVVEAGRPAVGVLAAPSLGLMFAATSGGGVTLNGEPIAVSSATSLAGARFASSRRYAAGVADRAGAPASEIRYVPSLAYRLALVASGSVDVAVAKGNARDWDLAAADLLVHEAGGRVADLSGATLLYNRPVTTHPAIVAATSALFAQAADLVRSVEDQARLATLPGEV